MPASLSNDPRLQYLALIATRATILDHQPQTNFTRTKAFLSLALGLHLYFIHFLQQRDVLMYWTIVSSGIIRFPNLPPSFDALNDAKEQSRNHQQDRDPKPLDSSSIVVPPLLDRPRAAIIKVLLQDDKPVMPEAEVVNLSLLEFELTTFHCAWIQPELCLLFPEPFSRVFVMRWEEQSKRANCLFHESGRKKVAG